MKRMIYKEIYTGRTDNEPRWKSILKHTLLMVGILIVTILFAELLHTMDFPPQALIMVYILSVLIISLITPTYIYGIAAALVSTLACDYFITAPRLGFSFTLGFPMTLFTMLVATFLISTLVIQVKIHDRIATDRELRVQLLFEINQKLLASRDLDTVINITNEYLSSRLQRPVIFYTSDPLSSPEDGSAPPPKASGEDTEAFDSGEERKRVHRIFRSADAESVDLDDTHRRILYIPVVSKDKTLGVIGVNSAKQDFTQNNLTFVQMLAGQVALALELRYMSDEQNRILVDSEKEKIRSTLLRSISHDLRTPLTSILGASSAILEQEDMEDASAKKLVAEIKENAQWLIRMVENILTITKINSETMKLHKTLEAAEEVVSQTVAIVRKRFPDCNIHIRIPDELLMVPMDATLISQVLINLLENAVKNSPEIALILLDLKKQGSFAKFDISDNGNGIPEHLLDDLFDFHAPAKEQAVDASRGMGIGLSICKTIIQAHGGTIEGHNRKEGGARFSFLLPLQESDRDGE